MENAQAQAKAAVEKGLNRLDEKAKAEAKHPPAEVKSPPDSPPVPPKPDMRQVNLQLIPWDVKPDPKDKKNAENAIYFIRVWNPNDEKWSVVASQDVFGGVKPTPFVGEKDMKDMLVLMKKNNPMLKLGWVKYKPKGTGE